MRLRMFLEYRTATQAIAKVAAAQFLNHRAGWVPRCPPIHPTSFLPICKELVIMTLFAPDHGVLVLCRRPVLCIMKPYDSDSGRHI